MRTMEVLRYAPGVTPTAAGDAVRELLQDNVYAPPGGEDILRDPDGLYEGQTFAYWLNTVRDALGFDPRAWIVVEYHDIAPDEVCEPQTRALLAVHHGERLVIKMVFPECTDEG
jgi:hypothetical protein